MHVMEVGRCVREIRDLGGAQIAMHDGQIGLLACPLHGRHPPRPRDCQWSTLFCPSDQEAGRIVPLA